MKSQPMRAGKHGGGTLGSPMPAPATLVIETSTPGGSLALAAGGSPPQELAFGSDRSHNTGIFAPLEALLRTVPPPGVARVLVGSGPGSYSGTRVGIAAAQGVAIVHGCPAVAVPSILAVPSADGGAAVLVIGDARRGAYWTARVEGHRLCAGPDLTDAQGLAGAVRHAIDSGHAVVTFEEARRFPLEPELLAVIATETPDAGRLWHAWCGSDAATRDAWESAPPEPLYLKPPHITESKRPPLVP